MSATGTRHEDAPKKIDDRVISEERLSWMQTLETGESFALSREPNLDADQLPEIPSGAALERDEIRDRLLRAISNTESARRMNAPTPVDGRQAHAPACTEPPRRQFPASGAEIQRAPRMVQRAPAARSTGAFLVQNTPVASSMPLMPPPAAPSHHPMPPEPDSIVERDEARERLLRAICATEIAGRLEGEFTASNPRSRMRVQTSPQAASAPLMPPPTALPQRRASATTSRPATASRMVGAATFAAIPQVPSPPQPVAVTAGSVPAITAAPPPAPAQDDSPRVSILAWCNGEINRLGAKLALAAKSMGRAALQFSVGFRNRAVPKAALAVDGTSRAAIQLSIHFKKGMETKALPAIKHLGRSFWRLSIRLWSRAEARAPLTVKSTDVAASLPSTRLDDRAPATRSAPRMESVDEPRPQSPTRLKRWFGPRRSSRLAMPPAVAYCWTADTPHPIKIADISSGGVHLLTDVRWPRGGALSMTLQRTDRTKEMPESWIVIDFIVTRYCDDGVAGAFIPSNHRLSPFIPSRADNCADERTLKHFVRQLAVPGGG